MKSLYLIVLLALLSFKIGFAQSITTKQANKLYANLHYANAAELFEQAIAYGDESQETYLKLADCYFKIKDSKNAEKYYKKIIGPFLENTAFQYAQSLLQNGKYVEAKEWLASKSFSSQRILSIQNTDIEKLLDDSSVKAVHFMEFNSLYADFSPTPYENGIVFASSRKKGTLHQHVFGWSNTPFLNLFYIDTTGLIKTAHQKKIEQEHYQENSKKHIYAYDSRLHADETVLTSNDVNTVGYFGGYVRQTDSLFGSKKVVPFEPRFHTKYHEGPIAFHPQENLAVFTRNNLHKGKYGKNQKGINQLKLFTSTKENGKWTAPMPVPFSSNEYSVGHASFDPSGKVMYFASDMPGGYGGTDIYKVTYNSGNWGKPENLGTSVNTDGNELFPYASPSGLLFFSSDGQGGLGGLDLFATNMTGQTKNLGYPLNSNKDDFGISIDAAMKKGFFSSNRNRTGLDDDIYSFEFLKPFTLSLRLEILVVDRATGKPIPGAQVIPTTESLASSNSDERGMSYFDIIPSTSYGFISKKSEFVDGSASVDGQQPLPSPLTIFLDYTSSLYLLVTDRTSNTPIQDVKVKISNQLDHSVLLEDKTSLSGDLRKNLIGAKINDELAYSLHFEREGYLAKTVAFNYRITKPGEIPIHELLDIKLDKIELGMDIGKIVHINPIYFNVNKSNIRKDAALELDKIVDVMNDNPNMIIELGSHTDCRSSAQYNMALSARRAKSSAQYIVSKGIGTERIYGKGYGEAKLINGCACEGPVKSTCTEQEHQLNRRTEFIIVKN